MTNQPQGKFKVLKASAGSGKTYALVKEFLLLALQTKKSDYYKHVLALTFTNAAAAEMKERVLGCLKNFAVGNKKTQALFDEIAIELNLDSNELQTRSANVFKHILHHYGQLSISTIDSFTHRLIRTFSRDLRLSQDFTIEMDVPAFLEEVVDACLAKFGVEEDLTIYLKQVAIDRLESESSWTLRKSILDFAKEMLKEEASDALNLIGELSLEDFKKIRSNLFTAQTLLENKIKEPAKAVQKILKHEGLVHADLHNGGSGNFSAISKIVEGEVVMLKPTFHKTIGLDDWASKKADAAAREKIDRVKSELKVLFIEIADALSDSEFVKYSLRKSILSNIYEMGLMSRLKSIADGIKRDQNILLIKDFHDLINDVVSENEAPFIYERIGNKYKHILFDEFQDTSVLQWNNAIPLVQNALSENNLNLIVGDGKQSIYRWRGGRAEQFVQLPEVRAAGIHASSAAVFSMHYQPQNLTKNYRSARAIIQFNNDLYEKLASKIPAASKVYESHQQQQVRNEEGYVSVTNVEHEKDEEGRLWIVKEVLKKTREAIAAGYKPCDIAILTRKGAAEGGVIASHLKSAGLEVETKDSFLLRFSPKVRAVMSYLIYTTNSANHYAAVECARAISEGHPSATFDSFVSNHILRNTNNSRDLIVDLKGWLTLYFGAMEDFCDAQSTYSFVVKLIRHFNFNTDTYLEFLLDNVRQRCVKSNASLSKLCEWWQTSQHKVYITSASNEQAVQVMTVHKSKGLQFPVVIYPRFAAGPKYDKIWIATDEKQLGLKTALVARKSMSEENPELWPSEFLEEENKILLDDLNLCYVATTRAEQRLYILNEKRAKNTALSKVLNDVLEKDFATYKVNEKEWEFGTRLNATIGNYAAAGEEMQHCFGVSNDFVMRSSPCFNQEIEESIRYGNRVHECFSRIKTKNDIDMGIAKSVQDIEPNERELIIKRLEADVSHIVNGEKTQRWFYGFLQLFIERELQTVEGKTLRPDRVMIYEDRIEVVDFKTGTFRKEHGQQLDSYIKGLSEIYNKPIVGEVVYVGTE